MFRIVNMDELNAQLTGRMQGGGGRRNGSYNIIGSIIQHAYRNEIQTAISMFPGSQKVRSVKEVDKRNVDPCPLASIGIY